MGFEAYALKGGLDAWRERFPTSEAAALTGAAGRH
jgi:hypothetical protein